MIIAEASAHLPLWQDYLQTQFDPAHLLSELGFTVVFDFLIGWFFWGKLIKPYLDRRTAQIHQEIDAEHGVTPQDHARWKRRNAVSPAAPAPPSRAKKLRA